jgi:hypothetical protein
LHGVTVRSDKSRGFTTEMDQSLDGWAGVLLAAAVWRKSSYSGHTECVTVAEISEDVAVRNSNSPERGTLMFGRRALAAWIVACKTGEFDDLTA